ncbi:MAG: helix-turn-helix transcriptional regulator [Desulfobacula sp.]|jgi:DNA-binding CsgD family transcriptional regulator|uniref:helix-turn-helix domain-containing protein n=1 Tax=Desulfobacula sp. TaxID=2593537 RepID=UPI001DEE1126|nr:helix-turn-helix transcriptional regulator [Desulfobacula sp.]MBT3485961.1 helix-turn-helix transcriptional regulator [Desulfobacula sp.]MBT3805187.1 helix-turn-helix transcriptional regulator [Desulfobacula sp.]MBT4025508.1 helix-turn-helix transcriptional regulator [Desulfobacula sp.]MBT4198907.1 helix-turn-helix transcriptional regulator [Desulfobacula sp.]
MANGRPENVNFNQMNYLDICEAAVGDGIKDAMAVASGIRQIINREREGRLSEKDRTLVNILDDHLKDIISPLMQNFNNAGVMLTPQELQVASLVKDGKTTSEIADILFVSETTISFHRKNLRHKLGLRNRQANLRSFLLSMSSR